MEEKVIWYDKKYLVLFLTIVLPPIGFFGLYKTEFISKEALSSIVGVPIAISLIGAATTLKKIRFVQHDTYPFLIRSGTKNVTATGNIRGCGSV